jgi:hypothetical protein
MKGEPVNASTNQSPTPAHLVVALAFAALTAGCTHHYQITPAYQPALAGLPARPVCAQGESLAVSVTNRSGEPLDAGVVQAGIHTFEHRFSHDPATTLAEGITAALREGHCASASPGIAALSVEIVNMTAHGETCGFIACEGVAGTSVSVTLKDATGRVLLQDQLSTDVKGDCGMIFCNEEETSGFSSRALSATVGKTVAAVGHALAKRATAEPAAATPGS